MNDKNDEKKYNIIIIQNVFKETIVNNNIFVNDQKNFDFKKNLQDKNIEDSKKKRKRNIISEEQLKNAIEETKKFSIR
jgi:hypothetical protein